MMGKMGMIKHCYNSDFLLRPILVKGVRRRYRLLIQKILVKCALDNSLYDKVIELEANHNRNYLETQKMIECYGYMEEFVAAVKEEETALDKIIDAYHRRMRKT